MDNSGKLEGRRGWPIVVKTERFKRASIENWGGSFYICVFFKEDSEDECYALNTAFESALHAAKVLTRIYAKGEVNLDHWVYQSAEPDWAEMAQRHAENLAESPRLTRETWLFPR